MYYPAICISVAISIVLVPFLIPIRLKSPVYRRIKASLIVGLIISILTAVAPETAQIGAPFHKYGKPKIAFFGCNYQIMLTTARFCSTNATFEWCYCDNFSAFATLAHCYQVGHPGELESLISMCKPFNKTITMSTVNDAEEYYKNHAKPVEEIHKLPNYSQGNFPVQLNESEIFIFKQSYEQFLGNYDKSVDYGWYLVLYWVVVIAVVSIGNWIKIIFPNLTKALTDPVSNWYRKHISTPATVSRNKTNELHLTKGLEMLVPSRLETIILTGMTVICLKMLIGDFQYVEGNPIFHSKINALLRFYAVRTGLLASALMPLLILFAGRNNFLQWATRWDYSTFIMFHRWLSRIIVVLFLVHSVCYSLYLKQHSKKPEAYIYWGFTAMLAGLIILVQGLLVLRRRWYEMFLILHIILAIVFIGGAWKHVDALYCVWFYYTSAAVWAFDRIIRICRLVSFGFPKARVYLLPDETLKVVVPKPDNWEAVPGGHAFIHFLRFDCFWQSHPFTYTTSERDITLFIKVKKGVTTSLCRYLKSNENCSASIRVAIEGSYGESTPAKHADMAVFIAGGNGIPGIFAEALDINRHQELKHTVRLIWVVREYNSLLWFYEELMSLKDTQIETTIYITRPGILVNEDDFNKRLPRMGQNMENELQPLLQKSVPAAYNSEPVNSVGGIHSQIREELFHIKIIEGRPSIEKVIATCIEDSSGSACFVTCGHPAMVDDIRAAVANNIDNKEGKRVDYYEQLQVWA